MTQTETQFPKLTRLAEHWSNASPHGCIWPSGGMQLTYEEARGFGVEILKLIELVEKQNE